MTAQKSPLYNQAGCPRPAFPVPADGNTNNPPFRTSSVDADYYMLRQDHAQGEHGHAMQP